MKKSDPKLDASLVWDQTGHLAETAVTALADGELGLLTDPAVEHSRRCGVCAERVGSAALLAVEIADALGMRAPMPAPARRPLPVLAVVATLAIAVAGLLPALGELVANLGRLPILIAHTYPVLARGIALIIAAASGSWAFAAVGWLSVGLLLLAGVVIARLVPRQRGQQGAS
jgi:hypothetical protein